MTRKALIASLAALGTALIVPTAARADDALLCGARVDMVSKLNERFKEMPAAVGLVDERAVLEVFVSQTGSWTILATGTDGRSCVVSSGEGWETTALVAGHDA